jgi:carbon monoxide dehydrogenase subunit G
MILSGEIKVNAPREAVFEKLNDIPFLLHVLRVLEILKKSMRAVTRRH